MQQVRVGFVTCVELGFSCVREIVDAGGSLACVLTLHDTLARRKSGRVYVDAFCEAHDIPLFKLRNINDPDAVDYLRRSELDWLFIIGWSQIAGEAVLAAPRRGVIGAHPTLLPVGRGRASIPWAILKQLPETGVTLFQLDSGVDTGPIIAQERIRLHPRETSTTLYAKVADAHRSLIRRVWPVIERNEVVAHPQDERGATYWDGRTPEDGRLTLAMSVAEVDRLVRAATRPYPGAFLDTGEGRLRIWAGELAPGASAGGGLRLPFADGDFLALDYEREELPGAGEAGAITAGARPA